MPEVTLEGLVEYLRKNDRKFSLDALRQHLIAQGCEPALIEEAITVYRASSPAPRPFSGWARALGCFAGLVVGVLSLVSLLYGLCGGVYGDGSKTSPWFIALAAILALLALGVALYPFFSLRKK